MPEVPNSPQAPTLLDLVHLDARRPTTSQETSDILSAFVEEYCSATYSDFLIRYIKEEPSGIDRFRCDVLLEGDDSVAEKRHLLVRLYVCNRPFAIARVREDIRYGDDESYIVIVPSVFDKVTADNLITDLAFQALDGRMKQADIQEDASKLVSFGYAKVDLAAGSLEIPKKDLVMTFSSPLSDREAFIDTDNQLVLVTTQNNGAVTWDIMDARGIRDVLLQEVEAVFESVKNKPIPRHSRPQVVMNAMFGLTEEIVAIGLDKDGTWEFLGRDEGGKRGALMSGTKAQRDFRKAIEDAADITLGFAPGVEPSWG